MKLKDVIKKGIRLLAIYSVAMVVVLLMAERVEHLNEIERMEREVNVAVKINK